VRTSCSTAPSFRAGASWRSPTPGSPAYHVATAAADGTLEPRPALDFAVNLDAKESDFAKARVSAPAAAGAGERSAQASADAPTRRIELWHAVAAALLVFLLLEGTITRRG